METAFVKSSQVYHLLTMNDHNWMADYKDRYSIKKKKLKD